MFDLHNYSYKMPCHEGICAEVHHYFIPLTSAHHVLKNNTNKFDTYANYKKITVAIKRFSSAIICRGTKI